jgi:hypothetical protein
MAGGFVPTPSSPKRFSPRETQQQKQESPTTQLRRKGREKGKGRVNKLKRAGENLHLKQTQKYKDRMKKRALR